jgi:hypothetical protein
MFRQQVAILDHEMGVGDVVELARFMTRNDNRDPGLAQVAQKLMAARARRGVHVRDDFINEQRTRIQQFRAGQSDSLALACRQRMGWAVGEVVELRPLERGLDLQFTLNPALPAEFQAVADVGRRGPSTARFFLIRLARSTTRSFRA